MTDDTPGCRTCGLDNRNGTHDALQATRHLNHRYKPVDYLEPAGDPR